MPLKKGTSKATLGENISEFHKGPTYEHTLEKFGKERANKQAIAVAFAVKRRKGGGVDHRTRNSTGNYVSPSTTHDKGD